MSGGLTCASFNSVIAYSVIVGALMASGKEVAGKIPKGKVGGRAGEDGRSSRAVGCEDP